MFKIHRTILALTAGCIGLLSGAAQAADMANPFPYQQRPARVTVRNGTGVPNPFKTRTRFTVTSCALSLVSLAALVRKVRQRTVRQERRLAVAVATAIRRTNGETGWNEANMPEQQELVMQQS